MHILSFEFLIFTAAVLLLTYLLPLKIRWLGLLTASGVFVLSAGWQGAAYLTAVAVLTWLGGLGLTALRGRRLLWRRGLLGLVLALEIGAMVLMKTVPSGLAVPVGLSYFTLQSAGLLIDCYWGKAEMPRNPLKVWLFVGYFPQLAQGPISTWKALGSQLLTGHRFAPEQFTSGFILMLWGFFKKLVIADRLVPMTNALLTGEPIPGYLAFSGLVLYAVRLYADFSGGMDVVRGVSRMLAVELPENFRRPFFSQSVAEYWRRWHITLGGWFRAYLMYPLTTSRVGIGLGRGASRFMGKKAGRMVPTALATVLVFLLIGLWHGLSWNAVVYGGYFGILMGVSMLLDPVWKKWNKKLPKNGWMKFLRLLRTWLLVLIAQAFAFTPGPRQGLSLLMGCFGSWNLADFAGQMTAVMAAREWAILGAALSVLLAVDVLSEQKKDLCGNLAKTHFWLRWPVLLALLLAVLVFGVYGAGFDSAAFVYANF